MSLIFEFPANTVRLASQLFMLDRLIDCCGLIVAFLLSHTHIQTDILSPSHTFHRIVYSMKRNWKITILFLFPKWPCIIESAYCFRLTQLTKLLVIRMNVNLDSRLMSFNLFVCCSWLSEMTNKLRTIITIINKITHSIPLFLFYSHFLPLHTLWMELMRFTIHNTTTETKTKKNKFINIL